MFYFYFVSLLIIGYLLGSLNFAIILCKLFGFPDPRTEGSLNPGATNVLRVARKWLAALVLVCDALKGTLAVLLANLVLEAESNIAWVGLSAFLGHLYPVFFKFKGGKGVATYIGVLFGLYYPIGLLFCGLWLLIAVTTRYSSLGAISAASAAPLYLLWFGKYDSIFPVLIMLVFLLLRHKENIKRLKNGTESKINL